MGRSTWKYQVFFLFSLILHSQLPFPSSLSSSLSSMPPCSALLHFSKSFSLKKSASGYDPSYPKTASWQEDKHCCSWDGVECDKNTSHVVGLYLTSSWLFGHFLSNSTLFFLPNLRRLNLADNNFNDSLIPSEFGNFKSLTYLNLSYSVFSGQIPFEISQLSSLVSLDLSKNELLIEAPVWKSVIGNLTQLRELLLDWANMSSIRPNSLMNLSSSLTTLSLRDCDLQGKLKDYILCLPSIQTLDLSSNQLLIIEALVWKSVIGNLTQLRELRLDYTNMSSIRPNSLMNLSSSLTTLSLRRCDLRGKLENNILCLPSIQTLDLTGNWNLEGSLLKSNWSCSSLKFLALSGRMFSREFLNSIGNLKSLKHLALPGCNFTGSIPAWLGNLTKLTYLDLSNNTFSGLLPSSLFNLPYLSTLYLENNQLVGPLPSHVSGLNLIVLSLRSNFLNGTLPSWLFSMPSLETLYLDHNQFVGEIGEFKCNSLKDLDLGYNKLHGSIPRSVSRLVNLTSLYLSSNNLSIMLGSEMFSKLKNLVTLDLSNNSVSINNNAAYALPNLQYLSLAYSNISEFPIFLRLSTDLRSLDLSNNKIYGRVPKWLGDVGMNSLYYVNLRGNLLQGPFPTLNFSSLQIIFFSKNNLTGEIPSSICDAINLQVLDLSHNNLSGMIPKCLVNSTTLSVLDLRMNSIHGNIPALFSKGNNFRNINVNGNQLEGPLPQSLVNCTDLEVLDLGNNKINGAFPYWLGSLQKLQVLVIRSNRFQGCIGNPKTKFPFPNLRIVDISNNQFNGPLPITYFEYLKAMMNVDESGVASKYMGENYHQDSLNIMMKGHYIEMERVLTILTSIDFSNNSFGGEMPKIIGRLKSLKGLNFSYNNLIGHIPSSIGNLTNLEWLDLSHNQLTGPFPILNSSNLQLIFFSHNNLTEEIPSLICDAIDLEVLDLSHNNLSGMIPKCLVNSTALSVLDLRMNSLRGIIPATFAKGNNIRSIHLNGNQLEGPLPRSLANCAYLEVLDLGNNKINGAFPYWLGSLQNLQVFVIRSNRFQGRIGNPITKFPFPKLRIIDISNNQFNGPLPITYFEYLKAMMNVDESGVASKYMGENYYQDSLNIMMKGQYMEMERVLTILTSIDFSNNSFRGEMPKIIGRLKSLKGLNFSGNNLIGYIPPSIGSLTNLEWLDLSFNKLSGEIPSQLADLTSLEVLKLSHNQLTGHIPSGNQFNTFNNDSYTENLGLCGFPLSRTCDNQEAKQPPPPPTFQQDENLEHENGFGWQAVSIGYACGTIFGMLMGYLMFKIGKPKCLVRMVKLEQHIILRRLKKNAHKRGGRR